MSSKASFTTTDKSSSLRPLAIAKPIAKTESSQKTHPKLLRQNAFYDASTSNRTSAAAVAHPKLLRQNALYDVSTSNRTSAAAVERPAKKAKHTVAASEEYYVQEFVSELKQPSRSDYGDLPCSDCGTYGCMDEYCYDQYNAENSDREEDYDY
jgi:hypothetical protein